MGGDPLERLLFTPTPAQKRIMGLRRRLGRALVRADEYRARVQGAHRTAERRDDRIAELEAQLLAKRAEAGGFRLAAFELLDPETFRAIDDRCERTRNGDGVLPDPQPEQCGGSGEGRDV